MGFTFGFAKAMNARRLTILVAVLVLTLLAAISLRSLPAVSSAGWDVLAASGEVEWRGPDVRIGGWQDLQRADRLPDGAELRTGSDGTAIVAKGLDRIELRPNTELVVAARASSFGKMEIDQTAGSATYTVEKRPSGTFSVHTPFVVAVVKGTKFSVDIEAQETSVSVSEGRVGVSDARSGESKDVTSGQTARSSARAAGLDVDATPEPTKASKAAPKSGIKTKPSAKANTNEPTRGNSSNAPGHNKEAGASASSSSGRAGDNGVGNDRGNAGGKGNGAGNGASKGNAGGNGKGNAGGNGKGKGKGL